MVRCSSRRNETRTVPRRPKCVRPRAGRRRRRRPCAKPNRVYTRHGGGPRDQWRRGRPRKLSTGRFLLNRVYAFTRARARPTGPKFKRTNEIKINPFAAAAADKANATRSSFSVRPSRGRLIILKTYTRRRRVFDVPSQYAYRRSPRS